MDSKKGLERGEEDQKGNRCGTHIRKRLRRRGMNGIERRYPLTLKISLLPE